MTWDDSFSVQVQEIDSQHQRLIEMLNQLHDMMKSGQGKDAIGPVLEDLTNYTVTHFGTEETYFDQYGYEHTQAHKVEHRAFVDKVSKFKSDFDAGNVNLSIELMQFLKDWLVNHIKGSDQKYVACFKEHGLS